MKNQKTAELVETLNKKVEDFKNTDEYMKYLKFTSSFRSYSWNNRILLYCQNPNITYVKGMKSWNTLNRKVNAGEKALWILAPIIKKVEVKNAETEELEKKEEKIFGFRTVPVFDIAQTNGADITTAKDLVKTLSGDIENFDEIVDKARLATNATITFDNNKAKEKGYFNPETNEIVIHRTGNSEFQQLKTLFHEITHSLLHSKEAMDTEWCNTNVKECEAESTAYVVMHSLGYNTEEYSLGYLAGWEGQETDLIKKSIERITRTADKILDVIQQKEATTTM